MTVTLDSVMAALRTVQDPDLHKDLVTLGMIKDLKIEADFVSLRVVLTTPACPVKAQIEQQVKDALVRIAGATRVSVKMDAEVPKSRATGIDKHGIPGVKHIIAVSSGKGGVGKSTVAANLATALAKLGGAVGLLDSDVYGPNIPTMMGAHDTPSARMDEKRGELILPIEAHGVKVMSMGVLVRGDQPAVWRGPMLHGVVSQFLFKVDWGNLDYLVIDMPPGTGDVQLSLTQLVPVSGAVVVTTPQEVALQDVRKAILMFEKVSVPILGIVENMSYFICDNCDKRHSIFGTDGGKVLAEKYRTKLLAQIPLAANVREAGDFGSPVVVRNPDSYQARAFLDMAKAVAQQISIQSADTGVAIGKF